MILGGYEPFTTIDYPEKLATIVFTQYCNFKCPFCHNGPLLDEKRVKNELIKEEDFFRFLITRKNMLKGVVVSGGEPTIQGRLIDFCTRIKSLGFLVKLDTNGSNPNVIQKLINLKVIDYIAMDIKAPINMYDILTSVKDSGYNIKDSINVISKSGIEHMFRTTEVPILKETDKLKIKSLVPKGSLHIFQQFKPYNALDISKCV